MHNFAPVESWESWTWMTFPEDGQYVFPGGLAPLTVSGGQADYWNRTSGCSTTLPTDPDRTPAVTRAKALQILRFLPESPHSGPLLTGSP